MELNPRQQKLAFAIIVVMLAGLGVYLLLPEGTGGSHAATPAPAPTATTAPATPATPGTTGPAEQPTVTPTPSASGEVNIFQWLPFTPAELSRAAGVTMQAAAYYDTFRYDENAATYGSRMSGLVSPEYLTVLEADYATFGVARQRAQDKEVSSASAVINTLRAFDPSSITFVVTISQRIQEVTGTSSPTSQFAITVVRSGGIWQVNQIQPASAGNH